MKVAVLKERESFENRVALTPNVAAMLVKQKYQVYIEKDAGHNAGFSNEEYKSSGAIISNVPLEIISDANIILKVQPTPLNDKINELEFAAKNAIIIGLLNPFVNKDLITRYKYKNISSFAMELVPRTTLAQPMDALSSQNNLAGYRAAIEAIYLMNKVAPMMMTAAGTIKPLKALVIGAGVAGLQAIATLKRMGCVLSGFDVRDAAKEQVESLGGKFFAVDSQDNLETGTGYAKEVDQDFQLKQHLLLADLIKKQDIVITTAQVPGRPAPKLITKQMVDNIKPGSVIIDMAASSGGNCELTEAGKSLLYKDVTIYGPPNLASKVAYDASKLYAKNLYNFIVHLMQNSGEDKSWEKDVIIKNMLLTHQGQIVNDQLLKMGKKNG